MNKQEKEICERIYERENEHLLWHIRKQFGNLVSEDHHDVLQETWRKLSENAEKVGSWSEFEQWSWLVEVADNQAKSICRQKKRMEKRDALLFRNAEICTICGSVESRAIYKTMAENALMEFSMEDRKLLFASTMPEEKKATKTNAENCKLRRLREKLKQLLDEE